MGDYLMSLIKANDITNVTGGIPTVKGQQLIPTAWVNFNGTGTVAIRDSENVSSLVDNGVGTYTVNFATNLANTTYVCVGQSANYNSGTTNVFRMSCHSRQVSNFQIANNDAAVNATGMPLLDRLSIDVVVMGGQV